MAQHEPVPEADALEQAVPPIDADADPDLLDVDDQTEFDVEVPEADLAEQRRARAVPAAVARRPIPFDASEHDVLDQRLDAGGDDEDDFR
jgi:hypothetical protein